MFSYGLFFIGKFYIQLLRYIDISEISAGNFQSSKTRIYRRIIGMPFHLNSIVLFHSFFKPEVYTCRLLKRSKILRRKLKMINLLRRNPKTINLLRTNLKTIDLLRTNPRTINLLRKNLKAISLVKKTRLLRVLMKVSMEMMMIKAQKDRSPSKLRTKSLLKNEMNWQKR